MNELKKIESKTAISTKSAANSTINRLPQELLNEVFSYLGESNLQIAVCSSKRLRNQILFAVNCNETLAIKNFLNCLAKQLNEAENLNQKRHLLGNSEKIKFQDFKNLKEIKGVIQKEKSQAINIVKTLRTATIGNFKIDMRFPCFFGDFFKLAVFERKISSANNFPDLEHRNYHLKSISSSLIAAGYIDRALEVAQLISSPHIRDDSLRNFSNSLIQAGYINRALEVAQLINSPDIKNASISNCSRFLMQSGRIKQALEVAQLINSPYIKGGLLVTVVENLMVLKDLDGALSIVDQIEKEHNSELFTVHALVKISQFLKNSGDFDGAIKVLNMKLDAKDVSIRGTALIEIVEGLVEKGEVDKAIGVAKSTSEKLTINELDRFGSIPVKIVMFCRILEKLNALGFQDKAIEVAKSNPEKNNIAVAYRDKALALIFYSLIESKKLEKAIAVADLISAREVYSNCFLSSIFNLIGRNDVDEAIVTGWSITNKSVKNLVLSNLMRILIEDGHIDKAITVVKFGTIENSNKLICIDPVKPNKFTEAVEQAEVLLNLNLYRSFDDYILRDLSGLLMKSNYFEKAVEVSKLIEKQDFRKIVLDDCYIEFAKNLWEKESFKESFEIASLISHGFNKEKINTYYSEHSENFMRKGEGNLSDFLFFNC